MLIESDYILKLVVQFVIPQGMLSNKLVFFPQIISNKNIVLVIKHTIPPKD